MELSLQINSNDKISRCDTVQGIKDFSSQSLSTQAKKGKQLDSMMPAVENICGLNGVETKEIFAENKSLKNEIVSEDEEWLEESEAKSLEHIDDDKKAKLNKCRKKNKCENNNKWQI